MNTKQLSDNQISAVVEGAIAKLPSAVDRIIARAWAEGDDHFTVLALDIGVEPAVLAERWNLRVLPALRKAVGQ